MSVNSPISSPTTVKILSLSATYPDKRTVHLDRAGAMNEETVRFYIAEIALAVNYLHSKKIVHR